MESLRAVLTEEGLVSFECKVVGFPTPVLKWFKDGHELKPGDVYQLTGTNSLGTYCCIARNCMGETSSTAVLTVEDIQNQLTDEERLVFNQQNQNQAPKFLTGLKSTDAKINEPFQFKVVVKATPNCAGRVSLSCPHPGEERAVPNCLNTICESHLIRACPCRKIRHARK